MGHLSVSHNLVFAECTVMVLTCSVPCIFCKLGLEAYSDSGLMFWQEYLICTCSWLHLVVFLFVMLAAIDIQCLDQFFHYRLQKWWLFFSFYHSFVESFNKEKFPSSHYLIILRNSSSRKGRINALILFNWFLSILQRFILLRMFCWFFFCIIMNTWI